jgi:hypothetical protein
MVINVPPASNTGGFFIGHKAGYYQDGHNINNAGHVRYPIPYSCQNTHTCFGSWS